MKLDALLNALFPAGHQVRVTDSVVAGTGVSAAGPIAVVGTTDAAEIGVETALTLAAEILTIIREQAGQPILLLVDTAGQRLTHRDELLGINGYLAHLAKCLDLARRRGHRILSLVYNEAVSGGFLSFGLMADDIFALQTAQIRVMNLAAMARVTKIPLEKLEALSASSPVFAPGAENYWRMGAIDALWHADLAQQLDAALRRPAHDDLRRALGHERGGRLAAQAVASQVAKARVDA